VSDNGNGNSAYDPVAALRALADAPRVGLEAAAAVLDRILALGRPGSPGVPLIPWNGETAEPAATPAVDRRIQLRRARADAERVLDAYGDWARQLLDGVFGLAEGGDGPEALALGPVASGAVATAELWLQAPPGRVTAPAALAMTDLTAHDGATVPAGAATFDPPALVSGDGAAPATRLRVAVPSGTAPGAYHGHVLAHGLPEVALAVRLEVVA
jgi:hypothetical protein